MIYIQFEAMPVEGVAALGDVVGAYVNCWINVSNPSEAEALGRRWIAEEDWVVISVAEWRVVDVESELRGISGRYVQEAVQSGASLVFYSWPGSGEEPAG